MAAVLARGPHAALSHGSAAALWRIVPRWPTQTHVVRFLKRHRLPLPELDQQLADHEVDAAYRDHKLVIEHDSRQFHTTPRAFEQDRDRDADLLKAGLSTLRITDHRLKHHATKEARRLHGILGL